MDFDLNPNSVGFRDMDPLQIKAFMDFVDISVECAMSPFHPDNLRKLEECGSDLIQLFGGNGLKINVEE